MGDYSMNLNSYPSTEANGIKGMNRELAGMFPPFNVNVPIILKYDPLHLRGIVFHKRPLV